MSWHSTHRTQWEEITDNCTVTSAISFPILFCFPFQMTPTNQNCTLNVTRSLISLLQFFFQGHYDHVQGWLAPKSNPEASIAFALKQQEDRPPWLPALVLQCSLVYGSPFTLRGGLVQTWALHGDPPSVWQSCVQSLPAHPQLQSLSSPTQKECSQVIWLHMSSFLVE